MSIDIYDAVRLVIERARLANQVLENAERFRDQALNEMKEVAEDPYLIEDRFDPGDADVYIEGSGMNVLEVLRLLRALGVPGCER